MAVKFWTMQLLNANALRDVESCIGWNYTVFIARF